MSEEILVQHKKIWEEKPVLRAIYQDYYNRMVRYVRPGKTLEIGGGTGNLKEYLPQVVTSDIVPSPWVDVVCDAQSLPFDANSFDNLVGIDVLHHIERPIRFFREAQRVLKPAGRIVLLDPAITLLSYPFFKFFHPEPVVLNQNPLEDGPLSRDREPFDANQAIPDLLFGQYLQAFQEAFPRLKLAHKSYMSLLTYPLSGGFRPWSFIPQRWVSRFLRVERKIEPYIGKYGGFRLLVVLEKV